MSYEEETREGATHIEVDESYWGGQPFPAPDQNLIDREEARWVQAVVGQLSEKNRSVTSLHYFEGKSYEEIAAVLAVPLSTIEGRLYRARKQLKEVVAGKTTGTTASLVPDPSSVEFLDNGVWHRFTVQASEPVRIVVNPDKPDDLWPLEAAARLEITTALNRSNWCPAESSDYATCPNGKDIYLAGCEVGSGTVELRRASDDSLLRTYTLTVDTPAVETVSLLGGG